MDRHQFFIGIQRAGIGFLLLLLLTACGSATPTTQPELSSAPLDLELVAVSTASSTPTSTPSSTATSTPSVTSTPDLATPTSIWLKEYSPYIPCADSAFLQDVTIPAGTVLAPGQTFVKTWQFRNTGSCTWTTDFSLDFVKGEDMGGEDININRIVRIKRNGYISITLTAPEEPGDYVGYWQLQDAYGVNFGDKVAVRIVVVAPTPTLIAYP